MTSRFLSECWQLCRFGLVGGATYLLTIGAFGLFHSALCVNRLLAATVAYFIGVAFHFTANKLFTFANRDKCLRRQVVRYVAVCLINYLLSMVCLEALVRAFHVSATLAFSLSVAATTFFGFVTLRFWVFARK